jgi:hypothetical protein
MTNENSFIIPVSDDDVIEGTVSLAPIRPMDVDQAVGTYRDMVSFIRRVMRPGIDFGDAAGGKPALYKAGAEKLHRFFNFQIQNRLVHSIEQWDVPISATTFPLFHYRYETKVMSPNGSLLVTSDGEANSYESKYRWRWVSVSSISPEYQKAFDDGLLLIRPGEESEFAFAIDKKETSGKYGKPAEYWASWEDAIAKGEAVKGKRKTSKGGMLDCYTRTNTVVRIPNEDIFSQVNTLLKMSLKRSYVGAVIIAGNAGEFFTSDTEDFAIKLDESKSTRMFVPDKNIAARKLIEYVRGLGVSTDPGIWIKNLLDRKEIVWSLENWNVILSLIDEEVRGDTNDNTETGDNGQ